LTENRTDTGVSWNSTASLLGSMLQGLQMSGALKIKKLHVTLKYLLTIKYLAYSHTTPYVLTNSYMCTFTNDLAIEIKFRNDKQENETTTEMIYIMQYKIKFLLCKSSGYPQTL
jgi:hypothetical protein